MAVARTHTVALVGAQGYLTDVLVEVTEGGSHAGLTLAGVADAAARETRDRIRAAATPATYSAGYGGGQGATRAAVEQFGGNTWWRGQSDPTSDASATDPENGGSGGTAWFMGCMAGLQATGINISNQW
jgi:hypothetical protein